MNSLLPSLHQSICELFFVGDKILCQHQKESFGIIGIHDEGLLFAHANDEAEKIQLDFPSVATALEKADNMTATQASPLLECFVSEYRHRLEQAKREAEVDAMWRTAMSCQL